MTCWGDGTDGALGYGNTTVIGDDETPDLLDAARRYDLLDARGPTPDAFTFGTPFDPADPVGTPNTANDTRDVELLANLGVAAKALTRSINWL